MTSYIPPSIPQARPTVEHVLAVRGVGGYRQYRIPALAVSTRGTILAAYDGRPNLDDLPNTIDLLLRRSFDNGASWTGQHVVRTGSGLDGYGDPSLLVDAETGRIFMFHAAGTHAGFFEASSGLEPEDDIQHADVSFSDDDGGTWQHRRLTAMLKPVHAGTTGLFASAGQGIQVHTGPYSGRLVQQYVLLINGEIRAASAYSDDHGGTWTLGGLIGPGPAGVGPNENKVVCLSDGRLLLHSRATPSRLAAISNDGGQTWSSLLPVPELPDPSDNGSLARFDGAPIVDALADPKTGSGDGSASSSASGPASGSASGSWLIATNNQDPHLRRNTVLSLSPDNGATWPAKLMLCAGSSAYSTATRLPDGNIGVLYERQGYREIVFASVPAEQLTRQLASPRLPEAPVHRGEAGPLSFDMELRSITPGRPEVWQNAGEFHVIPSNSDGEWDVQTWKEIGQGYADGDQILGTREAQDLNYGPIIPGYKAGDILAFTGRIRNAGTQPLSGVVLHGPHWQEFPAVDLLPGEHSLYFTPSYTVTESDLCSGTVELTFVAEADGGKFRVERQFRFDVRTGEVSGS